jgi:hypothetical protein
LNRRHIAVPEPAREKLLEMSRALAGRDDLIAIYILEGTEEVYEPGNKRDRIAEAVRLLHIPAGKGIDDFAIFAWDENSGNPDWDGKARWSVGWPCEVVLASAPERCPTLRTLVGIVHPRAQFSSYVAAFQRGPLRLYPEMEQAITNSMIRLFGEPPWPDHSEC